LIHLVTLYTRAGLAHFVLYLLETIIEKVASIQINNDNMLASVAIIPLFLSLLSSVTSAAPSHEAFHAKKGHPLKRQSKYPFDQVVVFGDNLSDNGNGTTLHHSHPLSSSQADPS